VSISTTVHEPVSASEGLKDIVSPKKALANGQETTVLSFGFDRDLLPPREAALRRVGYNVFSTTSEACVRFEIQMGQCGVLLFCYTIPDAVRGELAELFEQHCKGGVIAFVMHPVGREESGHAHICLLDSDFPQKLHLIHEFQTSRRKSA